MLGQFSVCFHFKKPYVAEAICGFQSQSKHKIFSHIEKYLNSNSFLVTLKNNYLKK